MKYLSIARFSLAVLGGIVLTFGITACESSQGPIAGSALQPDRGHVQGTSSGVGPGGHDAPRNPSAGVGPVGAGPAGSQ